MKWIDKIGIEVECGVDLAVNIADFDVTRDGSISADSYAREYVSIPFDDLKKLENAVFHLYTYVREVNETMGLHVHISLNKKRYYYALASVKFQNFFIQRIKNSELYKRNRLLRKRVIYTKWAKKVKTGAEIDQMLIGNSRYHAVNFASMEKHGTVEFRIFPAMECAEDVIKAVKLVLSSVNAYLQKKDYLQKIEQTWVISDTETEYNADYEYAFECDHNV